MSDLFNIIGAGGDAATLAIFYVLHKIDRRIYRLELKDGKE